MTEPHDITNHETRHLEEFWPDRQFDDFEWTVGPIKSRLPRFRVRRIEPSARSDPWVYVTLGAWEGRASDPHPKEFMLLSPVESALHVELLAMVAHLEADQRFVLQVGSTVPIGRPWLPGATADHLLVSLPYPFGPSLENLLVHGRHIRFLWLVPITAREAALVLSNGHQQLEEALESRDIDVVDPARRSVV